MLTFRGRPPPALLVLVATLGRGADGRSGRRPLNAPRPGGMAAPHAAACGACLVALGTVRRWRFWASWEGSMEHEADDDHSADNSYPQAAQRRREHRPVHSAAPRAEVGEEPI